MLRYCTFLLHLRTHVMLHYTNAGSSCTSTHKKRHATLLQVLLALAHTSLYATAGSSCTSTHTSCYATAGSSCTCTHTSCYAIAGFSCTCTQSSRNVGGGVGWGGEGGLITFKYTSTHTSCYATAPSLGRNTYTSSSTDITRSTRPPTLLWMKNKFCVLLQFGTLNDDTHKTL